MTKTAYFCWEFQGPWWSAVMPQSTQCSSNTNFSAVIKFYFMTVAVAFPKLNIWATFNAKYQMHRKIVWTDFDEETKKLLILYLTMKTAFIQKTPAAIGAAVGVLMLAKWRNYLVFAATQSFQEGKCCSSQLPFLAQLISIPIFSLPTGENSFQSL